MKLSNDSIELDPYLTDNLMIPDSGVMRLASTFKMSLLKSIKTAPVSFTFLIIARKLVSMC